jgi:uncharacterized protein YnzC (UPF0291/DUF896 family)
MSERKFIVMTASNGYRKSYVVTDITAEELKREQAELKKPHSREYEMKYYDQDCTRPRLATFIVSDLYDEDSQFRRAKMLAEYMNKIQEATERAIRNTTLIDAMAIGNNQNP